MLRIRPDYTTHRSLNRWRCRLAQRHWPHDGLRHDGILIDVLSSAIVNVIWIVVLSSSLASIRSNWRLCRPTMATEDREGRKAAEEVEEGQQKVGSKEVTEATEKEAAPMEVGALVESM
ncbi:hypothetical protein CRG98_012771 [Punica granatum]|uniref:Uncharacterized protein n=1 Tax=Punica granatum TaxID=22663 RepID=A0A2I0KE28_PUNGR|nr:hypothetical protein CRG98_012771 [Punica granatum]